MAIFSSNRDSKEQTTQDTPVAPAATKPSYTAPPATTSTASTGSMTSISSAATIDGNLKVEGDVKIDGTVKGTVSSKGKVIIGTSGLIEGDILCQHAEVSGKVNGKLKIADILFLKSNARVDGDIHTGKLVMESGVQFNGNCSMGSVATVPASKPNPAPSNSNGAAKTSTPLNG